LDGLCAEAGEHDNQIGDVQPADQVADPALELALNQRGNQRRGADDQAGGDVQQHALALHRHGLALNDRA